MGETEKAQTEAGTSGIGGIAPWLGRQRCIGWLTREGAGLTVARRAVACPALLVYLRVQPRRSWEPTTWSTLLLHRIPFAAVDDVEVRYSVTVRVPVEVCQLGSAPTYRPAPLAPGSNRQPEERPFGMLPSNERMCQPPTSGTRIVRAWQYAQRRNQRPLP